MLIPTFPPRLTSLVKLATIPRKRAERTEPSNTMSQEKNRPPGKLTAQPFELVYGFRTEIRSYFQLMHEPSSFYYEMCRRWCVGGERTIVFMNVNQL